MSRLLKCYRLFVLLVAVSGIPTAADESQEWSSHGNGASEWRYSSLAAINRETVENLGLAWYADLQGRRGLEATPIMLDGKLFVTGTWSRVYVFDAKTGRELWRYDPNVPRSWAVNLCCDVVNRGVAVKGGKVFVGTLDGRLLALDAENGHVLWQVQTTAKDQPYSITGAPRIVKDNVIIGNGGAEMGVRGFVSAYAIKDGSLRWRFFTVPGDPAKGFENSLMREAAKTWSGQWWRQGGGGTVWDSMAYDADANLLYIGTGNGSPWDQHRRSPKGGDNLYLSSIIALRPDTGEYVWHYQTTPGESWDYTAAQHMILAKIEHQGRQRKVIMQAPKNGFFYVLDRVTGELLSAAPYVPVNWASHIDLESGRPVLNDNARYLASPFLAKPSPFGGHNWHPMSYSPQTGLVYIPAMDVPFLYQREKNWQPLPMGPNIGIDSEAAAMPDDHATRKAIKAMLKGQLIAWDPREQRAVWQVNHRLPWNGGTLSTGGGLVFQGNGAGELVAYDALNGERLWSFFAQTGIVAPPITYRLGAHQYVAVVVGWGGIMPLLLGEAVSDAALDHSNRLLVFRLGGKAQLPSVESKTIPLSPPKIAENAALIAEGKTLYHRFCFVCHGDTAVSGGVLPDLRYSALLHSADAWDNVVLNGALEARGMASFAPVLNASQSRSLRHYVVQRAWAAKTAK